MELLDGEDLAARIDRLAQAPAGADDHDLWPRRARRCRPPTTRAVVHRDLKPNNIFICRHGEAGPTTSRSWTSGSPRCSARKRRSRTRRWHHGDALVHGPRAGRGPNATVDHRTDIFALGIILYEMLSGQLPFGGDTLERSSPWWSLTSRRP